jgi:hypothetical protein
VNREQFLLVKLAEECAEVAQRAIKQIQFGKLEVQTGQQLTNAERLKQELIDLRNIVRLLQFYKEVPEITEVEEINALIAKRNKLQKYLKLSAELGELPEIQL